MVSSRSSRETHPAACRALTRTSHTPDRVGAGDCALTGPRKPGGGGVATEDPELVDCGGAEFADSPAPPSDRTGQGGGGRPGWGRRRGRMLRGVGRIVCFWGVLGGSWAILAGLNQTRALRFVIPTMAAITISQLTLGKRRLGNTPGSRRLRSFDDVLLKP